MATKQLVATADEVYAGRGYDGGLAGVQGSKGRPVAFLTKVDLGTPALGVADAIIKAATSTQLPNATTTTYTTATSGTDPLDSTSIPSTTTINTVDGARLCWTLDTPRNVTLQVTHNSSIVALSVTVTGYDEYRARMTETFSITATGTDKSAAGKKAFAYIYSIAVTSAGNATTNTLNLGFGDVLGLPFYLEEKPDLLSTWFDNAVDSATVVAGVTTTATATTGDVRGTITCAGTLNGAKKVKAWLHVSNANAASRTGLLGVTQA